MIFTQSRISPWLTWLLAGLATLVWLPRLLGTEPPSISTSRPSAAIVDVIELPDSSDDSAATEAPTELHERQLLGPLETDEPRPTDSTPTLRLPDVVVPLPKTIAQEKSAAAATAPKLPLPPTPEASAQPRSVGPAVRYWIVSTRCCQQSKHKCDVGCHFVCHAVTDDCQLHPVCLEELLSSQSPGAPTCVTVHGSFTRWQDVRMDAECTYQWLRSPCPQSPLNFIYFTWPSEGVFTLVPNNPFTSPVLQWDIAILGRRSEFNGFYLADLVGRLPHGTPVCLLGHSLGTRTIAASLQLLAGGTIQNRQRWNPADCGSRIRVVFAAAAIDHDWFNPKERFSCALHRAECLLNLRNECDLALATYPLRHPFSSRSLGRAGFTNRDQRKLGPQACQVSDVEVSPLIGRGHSWPSYIQRPELAAAIAPYVYFTSTETRHVEAAASRQPTPLESR